MKYLMDNRWGRCCLHLYSIFWSVAHRRPPNVTLHLQGIRRELRHQ